MNVESFLKSHGQSVFTLSPDETVADAARRFSELTGQRKYSLAVACEGDKQVVGVLSLGDIAYALGTHKDKAAAMQVRDIMSADVAAANPSDDIMDLLDVMAQRDIRHMPAVEDGQLRGLIARRDVFEFLANEKALELEHLRSFLFRSGARY